MSRSTYLQVCVFLVAISTLLSGGCKPGSGSGSGDSNTSIGGASTARDKPTVAYVTNGIASFWVVAEAGARDAARDFDVNVEIRMPPDGVVDQKRMIEELLTIGVDGIAVSPIDPDNQQDILDAIGEQCSYITHDADAPNTNRLAYVGMSNYDAGRLCGQLVKEAIPEGGSVMIFVGRLEQLNARQRRQGLIDELMDRQIEPNRFDEPGKIIDNGTYKILATRTDNFNFGAAKSLAEDALAAYPDLACMVGLFAYNPPYILEALQGADKLGKVKLIGFDEADETLQAIQDGYCFGTVVQDPYRYGYESVRILAGLARGDESVLPDGGFLEFRARKITKDNVVPFWNELRQLISSTKDETPK